MKNLSYNETYKKYNETYRQYKDKCLLNIYTICEDYNNAFSHEHLFQHVKNTYLKKYWYNNSKFDKYVYDNMMTYEMGKWAIGHDLYDNIENLDDFEIIPAFVQDKFYQIKYVHPKYINKKYINECLIPNQCHLIVPLKYFIELVALKFNIVLLNSPINKDKMIIGYYDDNNSFKLVRDENNECEICVKSGDYFDYYDLVIKYFNYIKKQYP